MAKQAMGTCTECGAEDVLITVIDDETMLCEECLDDLDYIECERCHEFWLWDAVKFYELKDGRTICEHCAEALQEDGKLTEDDIDNTLDYT